jgi:hypothetical protein
MKLKALLALLAMGPLAFAQGQWSFHTSAEETILFGDQRSSYNFANLDNLAANSGIRLGLYRSFSDDLALEATLGVVGASSPNNWTTKFVPVELVGHYNLLPLLLETPKKGLKFNADLGLGSALVRAQSSTYNTAGRFSFSENLSIGASLDLDILPAGTLTFGYRHTLFVDDFLDATVAGSTNDQLGRFFTAVRVPLSGLTKKDKANLASAVSKADQLAAELSAAQEKATAMEDAAAQAKARERAMKENQTALQDSIAALQAKMEKGSTEDGSANEDASSAIKGYAVIVASYKNRSGAREHADELGEDARVIEAKQIERFRVAYGVYPSFGKAKEIRESLQEEGISCWIIKL